MTYDDIKSISVTQLQTSGGNTAPDQFVVHTPLGTLLSSYGTNIAFRPKQGTIILSPKWDYSSTTSKYRNKFLNENTKTTREKLEAGEYILDVNL